MTHRPTSAPWLARTAFVLGCLITASLWLPGIDPRARTVAAAMVVIVGLMLEQILRRLRPERVFASFVGLFVGAGAGAALLVLAPARGPGRPLGPFLVVVLAFLGAVAAGRAIEARLDPASADRRRPRHGGARPKVLDTSAIVDGRILGVAEAGFLAGTLHIPQFVLRELHGLADSPDAAVRERGQRALGVLERLKSRRPGEIDFPHLAPGGDDVDERLVLAARALDADLVTTDSNLERVAGLRGIDVLNIHALADALRPELRAGDRRVVEIVREGREEGQGLAFLEDGSMIVVEGAGARIGDAVRVEVTGALHKPSGRMFFARLDASQAPAGEDDQNG